MATNKFLLYSIESILNNKLQLSTSKLYLTNLYPHSLVQHQSEITSLLQKYNGILIPNFLPSVSHLHKEKLNLIVGDPHPSLHQFLVKHKYKFITIEELCAIFPSKVPLSYRSTETQKIRGFVEKRVQISLQTEPSFEQVYLTGNQIKVWDQALQVLLDLNEEKHQFIVEYDRHEREDQVYHLKMDDFLDAVRTCYKTIHNEDANIINYNENNQQISWILDNLISQEEQGKLKVEKKLFEEPIENRFHMYI